MFFALAGLIGFASEPENEATTSRDMAARAGGLDYCVNGPE
jgi:hypothetical protein